MCFWLQSHVFDRITKTSDTAEYFPRQFTLDEPRSVNQGSCLASFLTANSHQRNRIQRETLRTISYLFQFLNFPYRLQSVDLCRWQSGTEEPRLTPHTGTSHWWSGPRSSGRSSSRCSCTPATLRVRSDNFSMCWSQCLNYPL